jgi:hypothetical protein
MRLVDAEEEVEVAQPKAERMKAPIRRPKGSSGGNESSTPGKSAADALTYHTTPGAAAATAAVKAQHATAAKRSRGLKRKADLAEVGAPSEVESKAVAELDFETESAYVSKPKQRQQRQQKKNVQVGTDALAAPLTQEQQLQRMRMAELKELLRVQGLSPGGSKSELVARALVGVPTVDIPAPGNCTYEYDSEKGVSETYGVEAAPSGRSRCLRCTEIISQATLKVTCDLHHVLNVCSRVISSIS